MRNSLFSRFSQGNGMHSGRRRNCMRNAMKKTQASKLNSQNITVDSPELKIPDNNNKQALVEEEGCLGMGRVKTRPEQGVLANPT